MNELKLVKLWITASHPNTNESEASNAFRLLRNAVKEKGGVSDFLSHFFRSQSAIISDFDQIEEGAVCHLLPDLVSQRSDEVGA